MSYMGFVRIAPGSNAQSAEVTSAAAGAGPLPAKGAMPRSGPASSFHLKWPYLRWEFVSAVPNSV